MISESTSNYAVMLLLTTKLHRTHGLGNVQNHAYFYFWSSCEDDNVLPCFIKLGKFWIAEVLLFFKGPCNNWAVSQEVFWLVKGMIILDFIYSEIYVINNSRR